VPDVEVDPRCAGVFLYCSHQQAMRDVVKQSLDIEFKHPVVVPAPRCSLKKIQTCAKMVKKKEISKWLGG